jgi:hypothetical protein
MGYGAPNNPHSKIVKTLARSSLEAGHNFAIECPILDKQQAHFLVDSADKDLYKRTVAAGSGRPATGSVARTHEEPRTT